MAVADVLREYHMQVMECTWYGSAGGHGRVRWRFEVGTGCVLLRQKRLAGIVAGAPFKQRNGQNEPLDGS